MSFIAPVGPHRPENLWTRLTEHLGHLSLPEIRRHRQQLHDTDWINDHISEELAIARTELRKQIKGETFNQMTTVEQPDYALDASAERLRKIARLVAKPLIPTAAGILLGASRAAGPIGSFMFGGAMGTVRAAGEIGIDGMSSVMAKRVSPTRNLISTYANADKFFGQTFVRGAGEIASFASDRGKTEDYLEALLGHYAADPQRAIDGLIEDIDRDIKLEAHDPTLEDNRAILGGLTRVLGLLRRDRFFGYDLSSRLDPRENKNDSEFADDMTALQGYLIETIALRVPAGDDPQKNEIVDMLAKSRMKNLTKAGYTGMYVAGAALASAGKGLLGFFIGSGIREIGGKAIEGLRYVGTNLNAATRDFRHGLPI